MSDSNTTMRRTSAQSATADPAWDEAFLRVESYLRAHHLESRMLLNQLTSEIIDAARACGPAHPPEPPVALGMRLAHARIGSWFARAGTEADEASGRDRAHSRLALAIANLPGRWSNHFLSTEPVPPELTAAMASFRFQPGPELRFSNMPPATLEFGFDETGRSHTRERGLWLVLRAASSWLLLAGLIGVTWAASH